MSSRRKSSKPCMVWTTSSTAGDSVEMDLSAESLLDRRSPMPPPADKHWASLKDEKEKELDGRTKSELGTFYTHNLNDFREDEDSPLSECPLNTIYLCTTSQFSIQAFDSLSYHNKIEHPGEGHVKFKNIKLDSQTILEQTAECKKESVCRKTFDTTFDLQLEPSSSSAAEDIGKTPRDNSKGLKKELEVENGLDGPVLNDEIRTVSVNGAVVIPEPMSHVTPLLQRPPNLSTTPTIAVPLHSSKYNPILDSNTTLITSFNRFPYPTHAELSWLTAASKHPEEQIKIWFTTQRLKQGISWSPEEVEEARKKMFNGSMPPGHQTCSDLPSPEPVIASQPVAQNGQQILGQTSTANASTVTCQPATATAVNHTPVLKCSLGTLLSSEIKRPVVPQTTDPKERPSMPPPLVLPPERLTIAEIKRPTVAPIVPPQGKLQMVLSLGPYKEKIPVAPPSMLPKERLPLSPIVCTNLKRSIDHKLIDNNILTSPGPKNKFSFLVNDVKMPLPPAIMAPQVYRPTLIQTPFPPQAVPPLSSTPIHECKSSKPSSAPVTPCSNSQNVNGIPNGDAKNCFFYQNAQNDSQRSSELRDHPVPTHFPLLERVKGKSPGQMKLLEESFQRNSLPSYNDVDHLMITTRLSREEIESWFLERRALRDDMELALLNSMGSKRCPQQSRQALVNGDHRHAGTFPFTPESLDTKPMNRVFVQTCWPSPTELGHLEVQKGLSHTDLIHWFRENQMAQQSGILEQKMLIGEQNNTSKQPIHKEQLLRDETTKPNNLEIEDRFTNMLRQRWPDTGNVGLTLGIGTRSRQLVSDTD